MSTTATLQHMRALGYCNRGLRRWFADRGINWPDFLANGIDADYLRATGDAMAIAVAELAESESAMEVPENVKRGGCV